MVHSGSRRRMTMAATIPTRGDCHRSTPVAAVPANRGVGRSLPSCRLQHRETLVPACHRASSSTRHVRPHHVVVLVPAPGHHGSSFAVGQFQHDVALVLTYRNACSSMLKRRFLHCRVPILAHQAPVPARRISLFPAFFGAGSSKLDTGLQFLVQVAKHRVPPVPAPSSDISNTQ